MRPTHTPYRCILKPYIRAKVFAHTRGQRGCIQAHIAAAQRGSSPNHPPQNEAIRAEKPTTSPAVAGSQLQLHSQRGGARDLRALAPEASGSASAESLMSGHPGTSANHSGLGLGLNVLLVTEPDDDRYYMLLYVLCPISCL
eukprot:2760622-Prymnesium_polylepis.1